MSFIPRKNLRLFEMSLSLRRELAAFLVLVTLWALAVNVFGNMVYAVFGDKFQWWAQHYRVAAALVLMLSLAGLAYLALIALASGLIGGLEEVRRFHLVVPVMISKSGVEIVPIKEYWITGNLRKRLAQEDASQLRAACQESLQSFPGRPFTGRFYEMLTAAIANELAASLEKSCEFLLSPDAEFHGVDYARLADPPGPCAKVDVQGMPGRSLHLPHGCSARLDPSPPDRYGKRTGRIAIRTPYGEIRFGVWPQWAVLSQQYNRLSFALAKARLQTVVEGYSDRKGDQLPALWVLELPVEIRVAFSGRWKPYVFLSPRFEMFASWVCDLLDRSEQAWGWESFVERVTTSANDPGRESSAAGQ
jgi:hypothetical protein